MDAVFMAPTWPVTPTFRARWPALCSVAGTRRGVPGAVQIARRGDGGFPPVVRARRVLRNGNRWCTVVRGSTTMS